MNKNMKWRIITILVLVGIAGWKLYPPNKTIKLGLDLKGGMHLVLQVDLLKYFENKASNPDSEFDYYIEAVKQRTTGSQENLLLVLQEEAENRNIKLREYFPDYLPDQKLKPNDKIIEAFWAEARNAPLKAEEIIRRRIDGFGVAEPVIHTEGLNRIVVQLPGIKEKERAKALIGKTALLEFCLVSDDREKTLDAIKGTVPPGYELMYEDREGISYPLLVKRRPELTGGSLKSATPSVGQYGEPIVLFNLDRQGAKIFALVTQENIGRRLAIVLDEEVLMAPSIKTAITGGSGQITGSFTQTEVQDISNILNAGALPAPVVIIEDRTVSPTLGKDSIKKGVIAGLAGLILVGLFMIIYYMINGVIADIALCLNILFIFAALAWFNATLTLPGIAGIILTIGMAVDANVLINERIREESNLGKKIGAAITSGYDKAFLTILDTNLTTLFAAVVLFIFGTGPIRGFAVTLSIGIIASMFTAIFVTRTIIELAISRWGLTKIRMLSILKKTKIDFIGKKKYAYLLSIILIVACIGGAVIKGQKCLGIDFTGGQLVQIKFEKPIDIEDLRKTLAGIGLGTSYIQGFGTSRETYIIRTETGTVEKVEQQLKDGLSGTPFEIMRTEDVGPVVGERLRKQALIALIMALLIIIVYVSYRYEFKFAIAGILALLHDAIIATGFCILTGRQLSLPIIAAVLTVVGYSINDTIVIFDRIREDRKLMPKTPFKGIVNTAINQTLSRTILTSVTTLLVLISLYVFGGAVINDFIFTMLVGVIAGTYSTIYIASALVVQWHK